MQNHTNDINVTKAYLHTITAWRSVLKAGAELKNKKQRQNLTPTTSTHWLENYELSGRTGYINVAN